MCRASGAAVAVKRVEKEGPAYAVTDRLEGSKAQGDYESALREIAVLRALGKAPRRVCALREVAERKRVIWLVLDLAPGVPIGRAFMSLHGEFIGGKRIYSVRPTRVFQRLAANKDDFGCIFIQKVLRQILRRIGAAHTTPTTSSSPQRASLSSPRAGTYTGTSSRTMSCWRSRRLVLE